MLLLGIAILIVTIMVMDHECKDEPELKSIRIKKNVTMF